MRLHHRTTRTGHDRRGAATEPDAFERRLELAAPVYLIKAALIGLMA